MGLLSACSRLRRERTTRRRIVSRPNESREVTSAGTRRVAPKCKREKKKRGDDLASSSRVRWDDVE